MMKKRRQFYLQMHNQETCNLSEMREKIEPITKLYLFKFQMNSELWDL